MYLRVSNYPGLEGWLKRRFIRFRFHNKEIIRITSLVASMFIILQHRTDRIGFTCSLFTLYKSKPQMYPKLPYYWGPDVVRFDWVTINKMLNRVGYMLEGDCLDNWDEARPWSEFKG